MVIKPVSVTVPIGNRWHSQMRIIPGGFIYKGTICKVEPQRVTAITWFNNGRAVITVGLKERIGESFQKTDLSRKDQFGEEICLARSYLAGREPRACMSAPPSPLWALQTAARAPAVRTQVKARGQESPSMWFMELCLQEQQARWKRVGWGVASGGVSRVWCIWHKFQVWKLECLKCKFFMACDNQNKLIANI